MRLIYYALGGGLGHLVRARAVLERLGVLRDAVVVTASAHADDARVVAGLKVERVPPALDDDPARFRAWLREAIERVDADHVCTDVFPAGILGELCAFDAGRPLTWWHVARLMRWERYAPLLTGAAPAYACCLRVEALHPEHEAWLRAQCASVEDLDLRTDGPPAPAPGGAGYWLVVHSGPASEVAELIDYALALRTAEGSDAPLWIASPCPPSPLPSGARLIEALPVDAYFAGAQRIVTAAGYNVMRQTAAFRSRQHVLPFPRRYDDQFERAKRAFS